MQTELIYAFSFLPSSISSAFCKINYLCGWN